jgi:hypothetical protein
MATKFCLKKSIMTLNYHLDISGIQAIATVL